MASIEPRNSGKVLYCATKGNYDSLDPDSLSPGIQTPVPLPLPVTEFLTSFRFVP